ncbi:short-chain fatty acid transporter [Acidisoma cellulosilytica]|uniref:Short-chain fatty acid transporter n=1 Tax=Acidisoma cellulosilyticum TaxID=2802395 RepID=A0A964E4S5_9PROT|nr:TIGR00366 family protein [Acidisoma cellulosilyticum]MCB8881955.1 short-chain fatty acid transporter [Acidisoma cellulosilyticum]
MSQNAARPASPLARITGVFVYLFERLLPEPFVFAILLTLLTALLAFIFAPKNTVTEVLTGWYGGIFQIFPFAFQMVLILVTGYALTSAPPVSALLRRIAAIPRTPRGAVALTVFVGLTTVTLNWGFGLVASAVFAREIAKRHRLDFAWLLAGAYSGFLMFPPGLSSSIALAEATPGSPLNITQKLTGEIVPLSHSLLAPFNLVPSILLFIILPWLFSRMEPPEAEMQPADQARLAKEDEPKPRVEASGLAGVLDRAWILNLALVVAAFGYIGMQLAHGTFHLDINTLILIFLALGLLLHWRPIAYVDAVNGAARVTGSLLLQYPIYGGIMGMMTATGLAGVIAKWFIVISTPMTLPFWAFISSIIISLFVPSGGGHWAVQGPFIVPAAVALHVNQAAAAQAVGYGEAVANMIQPFWALPLLAIAGIGMRRVLGFTVMSFFVSFIVFGASVLFLVR